MDTVKLYIEGMSCGHCVNHVSAALSALDGVKVERVSVGSAEVALDSRKSSSKALVDALAEIGYPAQAWDQTAADSRLPSGASDKQNCGCCHTR